MSTKKTDTLNIENTEQSQELLQDNFVAPTEREALELRANQLGIRFRSNTSDELLREKISAIIDNGQNFVEDAESKDELTLLREKATLLVRVVIHPTDPRRTQLNGEIITVGNSKLGMVSKYVPYGLVQGYHVPQIILNYLEDRKFTEFYTTTDENRNEITKSRQQDAFVIRYLPALTQDEIDEIAARQRGTLEED